MQQIIRKCVLAVAMVSMTLLPAAWAYAESALVFKGCSIIRRAFMSEAAAAYEQPTGGRIDVMGGGGALGICATAAGDSDIGGSCHPALPDRFPAERDVRLTRIGWDALVYITHPSNPVDSITLEQAKAVLQGRIDNWRAVGGPAQRLIAVFRSDAIYLIDIDARFQYVNDKEDELFKVMGNLLGVQYVYQEPKAEAVTPLGTLELDELPAELASGLKEAALALDVDKLHEFIGRIQGIAPQLSNSLRAVVNEYRFEEILKALHEKVKA